MLTVSGYFIYSALFIDDLSDAMCLNIFQYFFVIFALKRKCTKNDLKIHDSNRPFLKNYQMSHLLV